MHEDHEGGRAKPNGCGKNENGHCLDRGALARAEMQSRPLPFFALLHELFIPVMFRLFLTMPGRHSVARRTTLEDVMRVRGNHLTRRPQ